MDIYTIITIFFLLLAGFIIFKVFKSVIKAVLIISVLFSLILVLFFILVAQDVSDFKTNFPTSEKIFLLNYNNKITAGFSGMLSENTTPSFMKSNDIGLYNNYFEKGELKNILGERYSLFIVDKEAFNNTKLIRFGEEDLTKDFVFSLLNSNSPIEDYAAYYIQIKDLPSSGLGSVKDQIKKQFGSDAEFKGAVFAVLYSESSQKDPSFLIKEYKKGNVNIYPERLVFKIAKKIPSFFLDKIIKVENGVA